MANMNITKNEHLVCLTCLSMGRKMYSIGIYSDIFENIMSKILKFDSKLSTLRICWECFSLLHNVHKFQIRAAKARDLMAKKHSSHHSLSSLVTITINETSTCKNFLNTQKSDAHIESESKTAQDKTEIVSDGYEDQFSEDDSLALSKLREFKYKNITTHKNAYQSKWAKKKILQKRKPQYKMINNSNNINMNFKRSNLKDNELREIMKNESFGSSNKMQHVFSNLNENYNRCDSKNRMVICDICNLRLKSKQHLQRHITAHYYKFECKWCQHITYKKSKAKSHANSHNQLLQCLRCDYICGAATGIII